LQLVKLSNTPVDDELRDFEIERPLQYSAIVVRKLIESWKVTDRTRQKLHAVEAYSTLPDRQDALMRLTMQADIETEFDLNTCQVIEMDAWEIANELLHSGFINWEIDDKDQLVGIYVASKRNQAMRLLRVALSTYLEMLDSVIEDKVKYRRDHLDADGYLKIEIG
jgi:hypothetical protein